MNIEYQIIQLNSSNVVINEITSTLIQDEKIILQEVQTRYRNSELERNILQEILPQNYLDAIFSVWGDEPTITLPEPYYLSVQKKIEIKKNKIF